MPSRRLATTALAGALALAATAGVAGCGSGDDAPSPAADTVPTTRPPTTSDPSDTSSGFGGLTDDTSATAAEILRFDAPSEVTCAGTDIGVEVAYSTRNVTAVGFAVDGASVGGAPAPTIGVHVVQIPCDGRVHTIMLIGSGADGPVFASKAVVARAP